MVIKSKVLCLLSFKKVGEKIKKGKHMTNLKEFLKTLVFIPSVTGYEARSTQRIKDACSDYAKDFFTDAYITKTNSIVLKRECGKENANRLVFDAHLDTIGFNVSEILSDGYLRVNPLGGIDSNLVAASEVLILGNDKDIRGVFTSVPPHLSRSDKLPEISEMLVDTSLDEKTLKENVNIGTPCVFHPQFTSLLGTRITATYLDDKVCIAAILQAMKNIDTQRIENTDIYVYLSSGEERGGKGSLFMYEEIKPHAAIILDVNFAKEKTSLDAECGLLSKGPMLSYSSSTSNKLTRFVKVCADKNGIPIQQVNEMRGTGTNADVAARMGQGTACAVLSVPIKYMHSPVELCDMKDVISTANLLCEFAYMYDKSDVCKPLYYKGGNE